MIDIGPELEKQAYYNKVEKLLNYFCPQAALEIARVTLSKHHGQRARLRGLGPRRALCL